MNTQITIAIIGIIGAIFGGQGFWAWVMSKSKAKTLDSKLLMGIAYSKIIDQCKRYIKRGCIDTDEYHELYHYLYKPYKEMGGNGTAERLMKIVEKLPEESEGDHEQN